jgi:hypothetical protein
MFDGRMQFCSNSWQDSKITFLKGIKVAAQWLISKGRKIHEP